MVIITFETNYRVSVIVVGFILFERVCAVPVVSKIVVMVRICRIRFSASQIYRKLRSCIVGFEIKGKLRRKSGIVCRNKRWKFECVTGLGISCIIVCCF